MINLERLREYPIICPDTETTGLHWYKDKAFGIALAVWDGQKIHSQYWDIREQPRIVEVLKHELPHAQGRVLNHNMKFDAHFLHKLDINLPMDRLECTSVRAALINEHEKSFSLDALGEKYCGHGKVNIYGELAEMFGGKPTRDAQMKNLHRAPASLAGKYAVDDPVIAIKLWFEQEKMIAEQDLHQIWGLERQLLPVLIDIEEHGVRVDLERAERGLVETGDIANKAMHNLIELVGSEINVNSPAQMRELFKCKKVDADNGRGFNWITDTGFVLEVTEGGAPSINKDMLIALEERGDKRAGLIMTARRMLKAQQFLKDHIIAHALGDRVYPNYNQTRGDNELGTGTGRFSIDDPALQQIPSRDKEVAAIARACFIPEEGCEWLCADWEQKEFRWFAHFTKDPNILRVFAENPNADYHKIVADITGLPRSARFAGDANAKQINLGLVFGMGQGEMAYQMNLPYTTRWDEKNKREWKNAGPEAVEVFNNYHSAIPGVSKLLSQASSIARSRGYVKTIFNRHIRFPGGKFTHKAGGLVFQGSAADCMKLKMVELHPYCKKVGAPMLLSVHDELNFSIPRKGRDAIPKEIKRVLETFDGVECPIHCRVPILSSTALGPNWWEASK